MPVIKKMGQHINQPAFGNGIKQINFICPGREIDTNAWSIVHDIRMMKRVGRNTAVH